MTSPQKHHLRFVFSDQRLGDGRDSVQLPDGSLWSHAATLGTRTKGSTFSVDKATVDNFVKLFQTLPGARKLCIDYEHGTVNGATNHGLPVPKAGDVLELQGVYAESDFTGSLLTAAEKLTAAAGRALGDERNFGLWVRWKPTAKALAFIQAGEITEMSIAFAEDLASNEDGSLHGPGLLSIALTNTPFLDDMVPVAASRTATDPPASRGDLMTTQNRVLALVGALVGSAVATEDEAVTELTKQQPELLRVRAFAKDVGAVLGETEPEKAVAKVQTLAAEHAQFKADAEAQKKARIDGEIAATFEKYKDRVRPAQHAFFGKALRAELSAGAKLDETDTVKAIAALTKHDITTQHTAADTGDTSGTREEQHHKAVVAKSAELLESDPVLKALSKTNPNAANLQALTKAARLIPAPAAS